MATFKKFEEIEAWKKARQLTRRIYEITGSGSFAKDFGLKDQIVGPPCRSCLMSLKGLTGVAQANSFSSFLLRKDLPLKFDANSTLRPINVTSMKRFLLN